LDEERRGFYYFAKGIIALEESNLENAYQYLEFADSVFSNDYEKRYWLATAYLRSGRVNESIVLLEKALKRYGWSRLWIPELAVRGYYLLGTAYQKAGLTDKAIESYQTFVDLWKDVDPELREEVAEARERLKELGHGG
jgi:tetratricopeptide (TPR) repeat protein